MESYHSEAEYLSALTERAVLPDGFRCAVHPITFFPRERESRKALSMNLCLLQLDRPTSAFAAVFTRNAFPGAPVLVGRRRLAGHALRGVLVNNRVANVGTPRGVQDAERLLGRLAELAGGSAEDYLCASTGVIGWELPVAEMEGGLPVLVHELCPDSILPAARAIMTTDAFAKVRARAVGGGRIVGIAKGAGMIEPNMATLLCFLCTDLAVERDRLREDLAACVERTLNRLSIDGDQSTSDTAVLLSSATRGPVDPGEFRSALEEVLSGLAFDIARNGEGTGHVMRVRVSGAPDEARGLGVARAVTNSPLVKTAVFGNDPNVGRIVSAVGDYAGNAGWALASDRMVVRLGGEEIFSGGCFRLDARKEERLSGYLRDRAFDTGRVPWPQHDRTVDIEIVLGEAPGGEVEVLGSDLSYEYVRENADYRS